MNVQKCVQNLSLLTLTSSELYAFNAQKSKGHMKLATSPFQKF